MHRYFRSICYIGRLLIAFMLIRFFQTVSHVNRSIIFVRKDLTELHPNKNALFAFHFVAVRFYTHGFWILEFLISPENNSLWVICKTNSSLFKFAEKHQPWIFQKILSKCCESFIMEITYDGMHAWLVYSTWTDSRYVVVWEHFHLAIILWYTVALVDERWEIFFNIRALKETFYGCFTWFCYC